MARPALLLACFVLVAGCAGTAPATDAEPPVPDSPRPMELAGTVRNIALVPLPDANVTLVERDLTVAVGPDGAFSFGEVPRSFYRLRAEAPGHAPQSLTVPPGHNGSLTFTLAPVLDEPWQDAQRYAGRLDCTAEYLIIPGSCDAVLTAVGGPPLFNASHVFQHVVEPAWKTVIVDVLFDDEAMPLMDGLRITVRGGQDAASFGQYEQYGRFHDRTSYTFRLEPGQTYPQGQVPVPANATLFQFEVYPQGHAYHTACVPPQSPSHGGTCFLGVGAATDIEFELLVTTFYVEAAPEGFTLL